MSIWSPPQYLSSLLFLLLSKRKTLCFCCLCIPSSSKKRKKTLCYICVLFMLALSMTCSLLVHFNFLMNCIHFCLILIWYLLNFRFVDLFLRNCIAPSWSCVSQRKDLQKAICTIVIPELTLLLLLFFFFLISHFLPFFCWLRLRFFVFSFLIFFM